MLASLYMLAMSLTHGHAYARCVGAATTIVNVVSRTDAAFAYPRLAAEDPDAARERLGRLLTVWAYHESSYTPSAVGDHGRSVGLLQLSPSLAGRSAAELRNPHTNVEAAIDVLRRLVAQCGSLPRALGAYASGHCGGAPALVARRCAEAGGC